MKAQISDKGKRLTEEDWADLEKESKVTLPSEYRLFLLENNGGLPKPFVVDVEGASGSPTDVQVFFGIARTIESSDLRWNRRIVSDRVPADLLPIACDSGGSLFCLSLRVRDAGSIIFVDLEQGDPAFYFVADGIDSFLAKLKE